VTVALDDAAALRAGDPSGMLDAFASLPEQFARGYAEARGARVPATGDARSVTFCAMGGSAAAGDIVAAAFESVASMPMLTVRGYDLPGYCGERDVVMCISYSGDTEETVSTHEQAVKRGCPVIDVCGGGELAERAEADGAALVRIPADAPVPRAGLGALTGGALGALVSAGVLQQADPEVDESSRILTALARELGPEERGKGNEAKAVAGWVGDRVPVVWGSEGVSSAAAWRWKTAFNENAEVPAFASALPELDHHEILGWTGDLADGFCLVVLREEGEHASVERRLAATLDEITGVESREVAARGGTPLSRALSLCLLGDMASAYHALARGVDPAAMDSLTRIKDRLRRERR
jgi:glucose/mannose-6-phosphate isomerase